MEFAIFNISTEPKVVMLEENTTTHIAPNTFEVVDVQSERLYLYWISRSVNELAAQGIKLVTDSTEVAKLKRRKSVIMRSKCLDINDTICNTATPINDPTITNIPDEFNTEVETEITITSHDSIYTETTEKLEEAIQLASIIPEVVVEPQDVNTDEFIDKSLDVIAENTDIAEIVEKNAKYSLEDLQTKTNAELKQLCKADDIILPNMNKANMIDALCKIGIED